MKHVKETITELSPNQIIRKKDGAKYFGYRSTTLDDKINDGTIPKPIKLGARAVGWFGHQILAWQQELIKNSK